MIDLVSRWRLAGGALVLSAVSLVLASPSSAAVSPATLCIQAKNRAAVQRLNCLAAEEKKLLLAGAGNPARCDAPFAAAMARVEARAAGACPAIGDATAIGQRVDAIHAAVLVAIGANPNGTPGERLCAARHDLAAARFASCRAAKLSARLGGKRLPSPALGEADFAQCVLYTHTLERTCAVFSDPTVQRIANATGMNLATATLAGLDLRGAPFETIDLHATDLSGALLDRARLGHADLSGAGLQGASLVGAGLDDAALGGADASGADLSSTTIARAELSGANLGTALLDRVHAVDLLGCPATLPAAWACRKNALVGPRARLLSDDLTGADLSFLDLSSMEIGFFADLSGADLTGSDMSSASFEGKVRAVGLVGCPASLPSSALCINHNLLTDQGRMDGADLSGADLSGRNLSSSVFTGANLTGANLNGVSTSGASFDGALLANATAVQATFWLTSFAGADFTSADFGLADLDQAILSSATFNGTSLVGAKMTATVLDGASFTNADLRQANLGAARATGASFLGSVWGGGTNGTFCPDQTFNLTTCCGHFRVPFLPSACSP